MPAHDVSSLVAEAALDRPEMLAVVEAGGRSVTWGELEDDVARLATGLGAAGLVAGQRVLIAMGNRIEFVTSYLGVLRAQVVAVPVNPRSTPGELARMVADSGARIVLADPDTIDTVRDAARLLRSALAGETDELEPELLERAHDPRVYLAGAQPADGEQAYDALRAAAPRPVPPLPDPEKLACLLYTSGTSGRPRAAMLTHRALVANIEQAAQVQPPMIHGDDVVLGVLPLFHVYGLNAVLGGVLRHRAKLVLTERFDPQGTLDLIDDEAVSVVPVAPPVFAYWVPDEHLRERLGPVRLILSGSAPLSPELVERFTAATGIPVHQGYGLTEASPIVTSTLCSRELQSGSVGAALPGIEIQLRDDLGHPPEGDDPGEIWIRGANVFSGYWPDGDGGPDAEGWWGTGDVGFLDASGDLFLVDRLKELVIVSGFNVYPVEVEEVIREVEAVAETAVIGVEDPATGEGVVAYVVPRGGAGSEALATAVRDHCAVRLARFKRPARVEVVSELPLTVTGKVQKGRLRNLERRRSLGLLE
ncbi:MAG TPA: AMP-binding protein [Nocardioides sp.]|jgi:long-chain acyl-CoA synthetase|uniref:class I adenylate-forming enzyme family protein n=1 Tax=Nocardioides sp. TaxID=35761 RepID=UPI002E36D00B|nr:AMP-binding protein [Nocardioides sp.]HEX3929461.1 AMP-binding protein [Nocardioides sp.]